MSIWSTVKTFISSQIIKKLSYNTIFKYLKDQFITFENGVEVAEFIAKWITEFTDTPIDNKWLIEITPEIDNIKTIVKSNPSMSGSEKLILVGKFLEHSGIALQKAVI